MANKKECVCVIESAKLDVDPRPVCDWCKSLDYVNIIKDKLLDLIYLRMEDNDETADQVLDNADSWTNIDVHTLIELLKDFGYSVAVKTNVQVVLTPI